MSAPAITVQSISKRYSVGAARPRYQTFREALMSGFRSERSRETFMALTDVSFDVAEGEAIGLIGRNGAGKSTLLRILSRITEPTTGSATLRGRVASLLEIGTGFHLELTGRENIFLSGAILGMRHAETRARLDEIVAFAEVEPFLDTPVKHYSSGMYLRLAFAVAAHLEPEILLVDEVLAVGDAAFQRKCLGKMNDVAGSGRTVVLVSHNMAAIESLASRAIVLSKGEVSFDGSVTDAIRHYMGSVAELQTGSLRDRQDRQGEGSVRITAIRFLDDRGDDRGVIRSGEPVTIELAYEATSEELRNAVFEIKVSDLTARPLVTFSTWLTATQFDSLPKTGTVRCTVPSLALAAQTYSLDLTTWTNRQLADRVREAIQLLVAEADVYNSGKSPNAALHGPLVMPHRWE